MMLNICKVKTELHYTSVPSTLFLVNTLFPTRCMYFEIQLASNINELKITHYQKLNVHRVSQ